MSRSIYWPFYLQLLERKPFVPRRSQASLIEIKPCSWPADLDKVFRKAGLQDVFVEGVWPSRSHLAFHTEVTLMTGEEVIEGCARQGKVPPETIDALRTQLSKAAEEVRNGGAVTYKRLAVVGRKPAEL